MADSLLGGALGGIGDFFFGTGRYSDPNAINPQFGVPEADVRQAGINTLANVSSLLLAAGQPMTGQQRAQLLAGIGPALGGMQSDIFKASQARLMTAQQRTAMEEARGLADLTTKIKEKPEEIANLIGRPVDFVRSSSPTMIRDIMKAQAVRDPLEQQLNQMRLDEAKAMAESRKQLPTLIEQDPRLAGPEMAAARQMLMSNKALQDEYLKSRLTQPKQFRPMTPEEKTAYGLKPEAPGYMTAEGPKVLSSGGVTVNVGGDTDADAQMRTALSKGFGETLSKFQTAANVASGTRQDFEVLDELIKMAPQGPIQGRLAQAFPGVSSAGALFSSFVSRIAPTLRVEGSGATSDIEYEGMLRSLPALINKPEANKAISEVFKQKAEINLERGDLVTKYQNGEINANELRNRLTEINRKSILSPQLRQLLGEISGGPAVGTIEGGYRFKGGDPRDQKNWEKI